MTISPRRSMTVGQMAQLFNGNPNKAPDEVSRDLFLGSSQGYDYLQQQGTNLGIGDPAQYFGQQRLAQQMASTPNGAMIEMARQSGKPMGGQTLRDRMLSDAGTVTSLQSQYPLPVPGVAPTLSPVMQEAARQQGQDPVAFLMQQRLGNDRSAVSPFSSVQGDQVRAEDLYHEPTFQHALVNDPAKAQRVFGALTGGDLASFHKNYLQAQTQEQNFRDKTLRDALASGDAAHDEQGNVRFRKKVFDPTLNRMVPTNEFEVGTPFQRLVAGSNARVAPEIARFQQLVAKGDVASLQPGGMPEVSAPESVQADQSVMRNTLMGSANTMRNIASFTPRQIDTGLGAAYGAPTGRAITHAAPLLRNNPQFQELLRRDPAKARRLILAIQQGREPEQEAAFNY